MTNVFDITSFGAIADGKTDCTAAIQNAIDAAAEVKGAVVVPPGKYLCGYIRLYPSVCLEGYHGWACRERGGSVLILNDPNAKCLLDLTGAFGCCVKGILFNGNRLAGEKVHGIYFEAGTYNGGKFPDGKRDDDDALLHPDHLSYREDNFVITDCQCKNFSGDGIHLSHIFEFTVSNCQLMANGGDGIFVDGWDGFVHNNIISVNNGAAIGSVERRGDPAREKGPICSAMTIDANRIEWNKSGGIHFTGGDSLSINNNFFDRNGGSSVKLEKKYDCVTLVGNIFRRNGRENFGEFKDKYDSSHIYLKDASCTVITGNAFRKGKDDGGGGNISPDYCIAYTEKCNVQIGCNAYDNGCVREAVTVTKNQKREEIV